MATLAVSGGIDSIVLMYELAKQKRLNFAVLCNYGQPNFPEQKKVVRWHINHLNKKGSDIRLCIIDIFMPKEFKSGRPFTKEKLTKAQRVEWVKRGAAKEIDDNYAHIPARNALIALYAGMVSVKGETNPEVNIAMQYDNYYWDVMDQWHGDGTVDFLYRMRWLMNSVFGEEVVLEFPFVERHWDKERIVSEGTKLGVDFSRTYSCEFGKPCGLCIQCQIRKRVLTEQAR